MDIPNTHLPATNQLTSKINMDLGMGGRRKSQCKRERERERGKNGRGQQVEKGRESGRGVLMLPPCFWNNMLVHEY